MAAAGDNDEMVEAPRRPVSWGVVVALVLIAAAFLAIRMPVMFRTLTGMDEEYYAVPGIAVARDGVPRIPYLPNRDRESVFWQADRVLLAEPPLVFYLQGAMVVLLGENLGALRSASTLMGLVMLLIVYDLGVTWFGSRRAGVLAALALSLARGFYFPATIARPDMTAIAFCLAAVWVMARAAEREGVSLRTAGFAGMFLGLAFLTHPTAIAGFAQQSLWVLWKGRKGFGWVKPWVAMTTVTGFVGALFFMLLLSYPEEAVSQFGNNILQPGGGHLAGTFLHPLATAAFQMANFVKQITLWQSVLLAGAGVAALFLRTGTASSHFVYCLWSTPVFLGVALGRHTSWGYYVYIVAVLCAGLGRLADVAIVWLANEGKPARGASRLRRTVAAAGVVGAMVLGLLPGAGLRTTYVHLRNWNNLNYDADRFVDRVLEDVPEDAALVVHEEMIIHVWLRRPTTVLATAIPFYFDIRMYDGPIDYALLRPEDWNGTAEKIGGLVPVRVYGDMDDIFSLKTKLYRRGPVDAEPGAEESSR